MRRKNINVVNGNSVHLNFDFSDTTRVSSSISDSTLKVYKWIEIILDFSPYSPT